MRCTHGPLLFASCILFAGSVCSMCIMVLRAGCTGGKYTALRQNRQVVDQWQSRIRMEQSVDALSLKNVQLSFVRILLIAYNLKWQMSYLFIFLCDNFPTVNCKMLNEFCILTRRIKITNRLQFLYNLRFFLCNTFSYCVDMQQNVKRIVSWKNE